MKTTLCSILLSFVILATGAIGAPALADDSLPTDFDQILESYEALRLALTDDTTDGVLEQAKKIDAILEKLSADGSPAAAGDHADVAEEVQALLPALRQAAAALAHAKSLDAARDAFYELTKPLVLWRNSAHASTLADRRPIVAYCPMAKRSWLQPQGDLGNPYYGQSMLRCGEVVEGRS